MTHTPFGGASSRLDHELAAFASNLDIAAFKALSPGIGLGEPRAVLQRAAMAVPQAMQPTRMAPPVLVDKAMGQVVKPKKVKAPKAAKAPKQPKVRSARMPFERRLVAWSIDFLFVLTSIATALALATVLAAVRKGDGSDWLSQAPLQWLAQFKAVELLGGVYGAFFAYFVLFKGLAGASVGEAMLGGRREKAAKQAVSPAP